MTEPNLAGPAPVASAAPAAPISPEAPAAAGQAPAPAGDSVVPAPATPAADAALPAVPVAPQEPAPAEQPKPEAPKTSLLTEPVEQPGPESKPEDKPTEPEKPAELPPIVYEPFTLPEGVALGGERLDAAKAFFGELRIDQPHAQKLVDMHVAELTQAHAQWRDQQTKAWADANTAWVEQAKADPEIGGNRFETSLMAAKTLISQLMHTPEERAEFSQILNMTGAGNNPIVIKAFARAAAMLKEGAPQATAQPKQPQSPAQRRYTTHNTGN